MTTRQAILIDYLKMKGGSVKSDKILSDLAEWYRYEKKEGVAAHDTTSRHYLTRDIRDLRDSGQAAIISNKNGIRLATNEENVQFHRARIAYMGKNINRERKAQTAFGMDGQYDVSGDAKEVING